MYLDEARDDALRRTVGDFNAWPNVLVHASIDCRREIALGMIGGGFSQVVIAARQPSGRLLAALGDAG